MKTIQSSHCWTAREFHLTCEAQRECIVDFTAEFRVVLRELLRSWLDDAIPNKHLPGCSKNYRLDHAYIGGKTRGRREASMLCRAVG
jgi:hypothetical protein